MPARIILRQPRRSASPISPSTRSAAWRSKTWLRAAGFIASCATSAPGSRPGFPASNEPTVWHAVLGAGSITSRFLVSRNIFVSNRSDATLNLTFVRKECKSKNVAGTGSDTDRPWIFMSGVGCNLGMGVAHQSASRNPFPEQTPAATDPIHEGAGPRRDSSTREG